MNTYKIGIKSLVNTRFSVNLLTFGLTSLLITAAIIYATTHNLISMRFSEHIVLALILLTVTFSRRSPKHLQAITGSGALLISSTILITLTNGDYAAQLAFPVSLVVITFYKDYFAYFLGVLYLIVFYYLTTFLDPLLLYKPTILALGVPYSWAIAVVVFSILASGLGIIFWRINDRSFMVREKLAVALAESSLKQRQALDIHDNIVQGLTVAKYSLDLQEYDEASKAVNSTLGSAKKLIGSLSADLHKVDPFLRYDSSEEVFSDRAEREHKTENISNTPISRPKEEITKEHLAVDGKITSTLESKNNETLSKPAGESEGSES